MSGLKCNGLIDNTIEVENQGSLCASVLAGNKTATQPIFSLIVDLLACVTWVLEKFSHPHSRPSLHFVCFCKDAPGLSQLLEMSDEKWHKCEL